MKKLLIVAVVLAAGVAIAQTTEKEKSYTLTLTTAQANSLLYVIDRSAAEHTVVSAVQNIVISQLQAQDSVKPKK